MHNHLLFLLLNYVKVLLLFFLFNVSKLLSSWILGLNKTIHLMTSPRLFEYYDRSSVFRTKAKNKESDYHFKEIERRSLRC